MGVLNEKKYTYAHVHIYTHTYTHTIGTHAYILSI